MATLAPARNYLKALNVNIFIRDAAGDHAGPVALGGSK